MSVAVLRPGDLSDLDFTLFSALVDTGATVSGVGPNVIEALSLKSYGKNRLASATEEVFADYYLFRLGFFSSEQIEGRQPDPADLPFLFDEIDGFSWSRRTDFDVIIGMDVLSRCDVHLNRYGRCTLQFG
jgi:hypothetical protein